jgi:hypothetical protein
MSIPTLPFIAVHFLLFISIPASANLFSISNVPIDEDTIRLKNTEMIVCRVVEIDPHYIFYQLPDSDSLQVLVPIADVESVHFENGFVEHFEHYQKSEDTLMSFNEGFTDAHKFYKGKRDFNKGVLDGVMTYFIYSGIIMLVLDFRKQAVINSNSDIPDFEKYSSNEYYKKGYAASANATTKRKLLGGYLVGLVSLPLILIGIVIAIIATSV